VTMYKRLMCLIAVSGCAALHAVDAGALSASSARLFRKRLEAAAHSQHKKSVLQGIAAGLLVPSSLAALLLYRQVSLRHTRQMQERFAGGLALSAGLLGIGGLEAVRGLFSSLTHAYALKKRTSCAEPLFRLLQTPEFKQRLGIARWPAVSLWRKKAEEKATAGKWLLGSFSLMLGVLALVVRAQSDEADVWKRKSAFGVAGLAGLSTLFAVFGMKPILRARLLKEAGIEKLDEVIDDAVDQLKAARGGKDV